MRDHVRVGVELLSALPETAELAPIVAEHHERYDGRGYPTGIAGEAISIEARIIAAAEAWTAVGPAPVADAIQEMSARSGRELDPTVVAALASLATRGGLRAAEVRHGHAA